MANKTAESFRDAPPPRFPCADRFVCLHCGDKGMTVARGNKNNPEYVCYDCAKTNFGS
jgi:hypothetical protein